MSLPSRHALLLAGAASCVFLATGTAPDSGLQAASTGALPYQDTDGDGLHDLLEARLGTNPFSADTDGDVASDLEEYVGGRDPLVVEPLTGEFNGPFVGLNLYEDGGLVYLQGMVAHRAPIQDSWVGVVGESYEAWTHGSEMLGRVQEMRTLPTMLPGMSITTFTLAVPRVTVQSLLPASVVLLVKVNGTFAAEQLRLVGLTSATEIMEIRDLPQGPDRVGTPAGLFPASPLPSTPQETASNEVCVQQLAANGVLGAGRMVYSVEDAYCDFMPGALCMIDCRLSKGDTVVGVDIPGLLGSLNN